ncbi:MAG: hypothetical protein PHV11_03820 [Candidatus Bipolaricaulis sp.]|nr:hypothetical protein [Candidatus Bipolaricaulis sp.]
MATHIWDAGLSTMEGETAALTPTTTPSYLAVKPGYKEARIYASAACQMLLSPKILHVLYYSASAGTYTDYVGSVTDRSSSTHLPLDAMGATDYLYLGTTEPVRGFYFDVNGTNKNALAATLDVEYCSTAITESATIAFTDVASDSDGTTSGGATLAVDGAYTFTLPSVQRSFLGTWNNKLFNKCYWIRFNPSTTLSATIDVEEIIPISGLALGAGAWKQASTEYVIALDYSKVGGFVFYAATGSPNVYVSWHK